MASCVTASTVEPAPAAMESPAAVESTSEACMSAVGEAAGDASMIEAVECAGMNAGLSMLTKTVLSAKVMLRR